MAFSSPSDFSAGAASAPAVPAAVPALAETSTTTTSVRRGVNVFLNHSDRFGALLRRTVHLGNVGDAVHFDAGTGLRLDATDVLAAAADDAAFLTFARDAFHVTAEATATATCVVN